VSIEDTAEVDLWGSVKELHSAFSNLVSNAIRYTPAGGRIAIRFERDADGGATLSVEDTGYGIPASHLPRITERFYRVSTSRSRESGGTGLGLSIVKHVLNLHQARLDIDSEVGRGSRFSCHFGRERVRSRTLDDFEAAYAVDRAAPRVFRMTDKRRSAAHSNVRPSAGGPAERARDDDALRDASLYLNRELSQLDFNFRVLAQAQDPAVPLLERLRYLCISCTNLDEFFEIRAATVRQAQEFGVPPAADGIPHPLLLKQIHQRAAQLVEAQYDCWNDVLRPALSDAGVRVLHRQHWTRGISAGCARISATKSCRCCRRWGSTLASVPEDSQ
jgi:hypothetical protein